MIFRKFVDGWYSFKAIRIWPSKFWVVFCVELWDRRPNS